MNQQNLNLNQSVEYQLLQSVEDKSQFLLDENSKLIQDISKNNSVVDEQIEINPSNLDDLKIYEAISSKSQVQNKGQRIVMKDNYQSDEQKKVFGIAKYYMKQFVDLFKWNREYDSFKQLYSQIAFDGLFVTYLLKQIKYLKQQKQESQNDERVVRQFMRSLNEDGTYIFKKASHEQKIVIKGKIQNQTAIYYIQNKIMNKNYNRELNSQFQLQGNKETVNFTFDKDFKYQQQSSIINREKKMNIFTSISASLISLFSGKIFKSKIKFDSINPSIDYYFFGKKIASSQTNQPDLFKVSAMFSSFNIQKLRQDQLAYLISILIASGVSIYFATKFIKNLFYLQKKNSQIQKQKQSKII